MSAKFVFLTALLAALWAHGTCAAKQTVCSITVNSSDEKEAFQRSLPPDKFQFVELVDRGHPDWLASACHQGIRCDVLVISGHYDGRDEFFSDRLEAHEFLPVDEMERASCSDSCSGLFSQLKEVYLFGCNTLNPEPLKSASAEIGRSLIRSGHSRADAERLARALSARYGENSRDRMRMIFDDVPVIYGFSSKAPVGSMAGTMLEKYFRSAAGTEIGTGRASGRLLGFFTGHSMAVASGLSESDPRADFRRDVCQFSNDGLTPAQKLGFVHQLMRGEMAEVRMFLDRIEKYVGSLGDTERQAPATAQALRDIARDEDARARYLEFARDADQPAVRVRMIKLAHRLGWLSPDDERSELTQMISDQLARHAISPAEVDLVCALNKEGTLNPELSRLQRSSAHPDMVAHAAVLACLGSREARARVIEALTSSNDEEVQIAQLYLRYRPMTDVTELRVVTSRIAGMSNAKAQVHALDTLASLRLSDRETLEELTRLFPTAESPDVQTAIAGILLRSDYEAIATPGLVQTLRESRLKSPASGDAIDVLLRRLQTR